MKKKKGLWLVVALMIIMSVVLLGCSNTQPTEAGADTTPAITPAPDTTVVKAEPVTSLVEQVKTTEHYLMFPTMIAQKEKDSNFDYEDHCLKCHSQTAILDDPNAVMKDFFVGGKYEDQTEGITCIICHQMGGQDMFALRKSGWEACTQCHTTDKETIALGSQLHHSQKEMIEGLPVGNDPAMPSFKYSSMKDTFSCVDCHTTNNTKHDFQPPGLTEEHDTLGTTRTSYSMDWDKFATVFQQKKCQTCHADPSSTIENLKSTTETVKQKLNQLTPIYDEWSKKAADMDSSDPQVILFNNGATYYTYVNADASYGVHNPEYTMELLQKAESYWKQLTN